MLTSVEIRSAFAAPPAPVPVTLGYRLRLLGIMLGMSALLILYLALIALVAMFVWYWLFFGTIFSISGLTVFVWLAPPVAGVIVILGLIRPTGAAATGATEAPVTFGTERARPL